MVDTGELPALEPGNLKLIFCTFCRSEKQAAGFHQSRSKVTTAQVWVLGEMSVPGGEKGRKK